MPITADNVVLLTTGACFAIAGKIVFDWLKGKKTGNSNSGIGRVARDVQWLRQAHERTDPEGVPVWYVPRAWKGTLDLVSERTLETNTLLKAMIELMREQRDILQRLK